MSSHATVHQPSLTYERLKNGLATHVSRKRDHFHQNFPHVAKKMQELGFYLKDIRRHSTRALTSAALAGGILLTAPVVQMHVTPAHQQYQLSPEQQAQIIQDTLKEVLPSTIGPLSKQTESEIEKLVSETLHIPVKASLDGNHLNTSFGRMGGEQHLPRYLGDTIGAHDALQIKGITPARGAFGYFAKSADSLTDEAIQREKYYIAVQTMYLPTWNRDHKTLKEWYKFRKVLVINPTTGKSVVAVIGDAGPAAWTGKHFGGSPEIMDYLQLYKEKNNGKAIVLFVDDQENQIALGPVQKDAPSFIATGK